MRKHFPSGKYRRQLLTFFPAPFRAPLRAFAVLVFPWQDEKVLVCEIADRGWCIPSGRVEPDESSADAARRETLEEAGAYLGDLHYIGCYQIRERQEIRWADCYAAEVAKLVEIQIKTESFDRKFFTLDDLEPIYHVWNDLTRQVFEYSYAAVLRAKEHLAGNGESHPNP
jgi:8-oxo-dGTP diphosphatase